MMHRAGAREHVSRAFPLNDRIHAPDLFGCTVWHMYADTMREVGMHRKPGVYLGDEHRLVEYRGAVQNRRPRVRREQACGDAERSGLCVVAQPPDVR
ncbi:MAG: hypothetical protein ABWY57_07000, partial [Mycetocola sp.]